jgi:hypothetical protein
VLESRGDERGDGKDDAEDLVGVAARREPEPDRETDEGVAEDSAKKSLLEAQRNFGARDRVRRLGDLAVSEIVDSREIDPQGGRRGADEVARAIAQFRRSASLVTRLSARTITINAFVKSSAPPTRTSTSPREKERPASSREGP